MASSLFKSDCAGWLKKPIRVTTLKLTDSNYTHFSHILCIWIVLPGGSLNSFSAIWDCIYEWITSIICSDKRGGRFCSPIPFPLCGQQLINRGSSWLDPSTHISLVMRKSAGRWMKETWLAALVLIGPKLRARLLRSLGLIISSVATGAWEQRWKL